VSSKFFNLFRININTKYEEIILMNKIRVYPDNCCFNRPYDNQDKLSIKLETIAKIRIQEMIKTGDIRFHV